jgi:hypothetical protein
MFLGHVIPQSATETNHIDKKDYVGVKIKKYPISPLCALCGKDIEP